VTVTKIPKFRNVTKEDSTRAQTTHLFQRVKKGSKKLKKRKTNDSILDRSMYYSNADKEQNLITIEHTVQNSQAKREARLLFSSASNINY